MRAELLPEGRNSEVVVGVAVQVREEPHLPIVAVEVDVRHALPPPRTRSRALQAREPEAEALLVVRCLDPLRMLRAHKEQGTAGRGLGVADIDGLLADMRIELDAPPRERPRFEVGAVTLRIVGTVVGQESKLLHVRDHTVPPPVVILSIDGPLPRELERVLKCVERRVEDHDRLWVVRIELGGGLGTDPRKLPEVDPLRRATRLEGCEHVDGRVEHAVDKGVVGRKLFELTHPRLHHVVVAEELLKLGHTATEATEPTEEFDHLCTTDFRCEILTGHGDLPFL